jgi:hypothetical protein
MVGGLVPIGIQGALIGGPISGGLKPDIYIFERWLMSISYMLQKLIVPTELVPTVAAMFKGDLLS